MCRIDRYMFKFAHVLIPGSLQVHEYTQFVEQDEYKRIVMP